MPVCEGLERAVSVRTFLSLAKVVHHRFQTSFTVVFGNVGARVWLMGFRPHFDTHRFDITGLRIL